MYPKYCNMLSSHMVTEKSNLTFHRYLNENHYNLNGGLTDQMIKTAH